MSNDDWYRNKLWNPKIEEQFNAKLKRARRKEQYLRIQASILASIQPEVSLRLLERYFMLEDDFDHAQAFCAKASALTTLGRLEDAYNAYISALNRESEFPNLKTDAYLDIALLVTNHEIVKYYNDVNEILNKNKERLLFPIDFFKWHSLKAIIEKQFNNNDTASEHAKCALDYAKIKKSGFRYHPDIGIVGEKFNKLIKRVRKIYA